MAVKQPDRPRALTPEVQAEILRLVEGGNYLHVACEAAGVSYRILAHWRQQAEAGARNAQKYVDFFHDLKKAQRRAECASLDTIRAGTPGWQGPAWYLSRRYPDRWGKKREEPEARNATHDNSRDPHAIPYEPDAAEPPPGGPAAVGEPDPGHPAA